MRYGPFLGYTLDKVRTVSGHDLANGISADLAQRSLGVALRLDLGFRIVWGL